MATHRTACHGHHKPHNCRLSLLSVDGHGIIVRQQTTHPCMALQKHVLQTHSATLTGLPSACGSTSSLRATCGLACRDVASWRDTCSCRSSCTAAAAPDLPQAQAAALPLQRPFALPLAQSGVTRSLPQQPRILRLLDTDSGDEPRRPSQRAGTAAVGGDAAACCVGFFTTPRQAALRIRRPHLHELTLCSCPGEAPQGLR